MKVSVLSWTLPPHAEDATSLRYSAFPVSYSYSSFPLSS